MSILADKVLNVMLDCGVNIAKHKYFERLNRQQLRQEICNFLKTQADYNEICDLAEEVDFESLSRFFTSDSFAEKASEYIYNVSKKKRGEIRNDIYSFAITKADANDEPAKKRVTKITSNVLDIFKKYYERACDKNNWLIASEIVDEIQVSQNTTNDLIRDGNKKIVDDISEIKKTLMQNNGSFSAACDSGDPLVVERTLKQGLTKASKTHPLYPDYGYAWNGNHIESVPLTNEAIVKYPPKIICKGNIRVGGKSINELGDDIFDYSYRHQLPIEFSFSEAKQLLGDYASPEQSQAEQLIGKKMISLPREFPKAQPYKMLINDYVMIEYLEMRVKEVLDDGTIVFTNHEQCDCGIRIQMEVNQKLDSGSFHIETRNATNHELLIYLKCMKQFYEKAEISFVSLKTGDLLFKGVLNHTFDRDDRDIDNDIDFYSRICDIEQFFNKTLHIPDTLSDKDCSTVYYFSEIVRGNTVENKWKQHMIHSIVDGHLIDLFGKIDNRFYRIKTVINIKDKLFGEVLNVAVVRIYDSIQLQDIDRLKQKAKYSVDGERFDIMCMPGENALVYDTLCPEEYVNVKGTYFDYKV